MPTTMVLGPLGSATSFRSSSLTSAIGQDHFLNRPRISALTAFGSFIEISARRYRHIPNSERMTARRVPLWKPGARAMTNRDILAIGTSAGGFEALRFLAREFSPDFPASVLVTIHLSNQFRSELDAILTQAGPLPAGFAVDGEKLQRSRIYIAPTERHLIVESEHLRLGSGPRENNARPALDPLFRSAALCCGERCVGAVLTGTLGDGAAGLQALKQAGGVTVVQDPSDAAFAECRPRRCCVRNPIMSSASQGCRRCSKNWYAKPQVKRSRLQAASN